MDSITGEGHLDTRRVRVVGVDIEKGFLEVEGSQG